MNSWRIYFGYHSSIHNKRLQGQQLMFIFHDGHLAKRQDDCCDWNLVLKSGLWCDRTFPIDSVTERRTLELQVQNGLLWYIRYIKDFIANLNLSFCLDEAVVQGIETNIPGFPSSNTAMLIRGGINHFVNDIQLDLGLIHYQFIANIPFISLRSEMLSVAKFCQK